MTDRGHVVSLRGVTFAYGPHSEPVLRDLDLTVPTGDHLAVVGPSGIGKSTLAGLLCGMLRPGCGTVEIDGVVAADLPADRLARMRVLIPQEAYVFTGTVWDNLTYLCHAATARQVDNAVTALGAQPLLTRLGGVSAELSPGELSAGQRQLIALVRAYLSPASVVVLDEATCHLDPAAERTAEHAFLGRGGTLIVIAHRISSALRARRILVLDGVVAVAGDHRTLLSTSPLYRELLGHWRVGSAVTPDRDLDLVLPDGHHEAIPNRLNLTNGEHMSSHTEPAADAGATPAPVPVGGRDSRPTWWRRRGRSPSAPVSAAADDTTEPDGSTEPATTTVATSPATPGPSDADQQDGKVIFGRVTEDASNPLPGATLTLTDLSGTQLGRDCTDAEGHYRLCPPTGGNYLVVCASASHQPTAALVVVADVAVRHDVALSGSHASLSGSVCAAESAQPVENAVVTLVDIHGDVVGVAGTDPDGHFGFVDITQGHYTLTVAAASLQPVARSLEIPATGHITHDVEVETRLQLRGVVRAATSGVPVPEASATVIASDGRAVGSVVTDACGEFVVDDLDPGSYTVIAAGYPPTAVEVNLEAAAPTETVINLRPPTAADAATGNGAARYTEGEGDGYVSD